MTLPMNIAPTYTLELPSTGKKLSYRPFLVKEEKIMLMATQSQDPDEIKQAIKQIIENCVLDKDFSVDNSPIFDIEFILINLRIKSVGNKLTLDYICNNLTTQEQLDGSEVANKVCGEPFEITVDLEDIVVNKEKKLDKAVMLTGEMGVRMRFPRFSVMQKLNEDEDFDFELLSEAIESVFDKSSNYPLKEQTPQEIEAFFNSLTKEQFTKITQWLTKLPTFEVKKQHTCKKCGFVHNVTIKDLSNLF